MPTLALLRETRVRALPDPLFVAVVLLCALVLPNPAGYVGGGGDDWFYVQAARCIAVHGWCVPDTHWAARWPLVAPMGAAFALFGDGRWQGALVPLLYSLIAVVAFVRFVEGAWGRGAALLGGIAFVATASFAKGLLQPNVETVELAWLLVSAWAGRQALVAERHGVGWAAIAGLCFGLAVQARMTSLAWLPMLAIGLFLLPARARMLAIPALAGLAVPLVLDMILNGYFAGDPLLSQHLSMAHTRIVSSELLPSVDLTRSPLFNPQFIGGWAPAMGIHTHWLAQGAVNLIANPQMGPVLLAAMLLLFLGRKQLRLTAPEVWLAAAAALYAGALIYALAIDPKARMFLPVAAIAAALIGRLGTRAWEAGDRTLIAVLIAALVAIGAVETAKRFDMGHAGPLAAAWAAERPGNVAAEDATRRFLTFTAGVRALPVWPTVHRPRVIALVAGDCRDSAVAKAGTLIRIADFGRPNDPLNLCEFNLSDRAVSPHH